MKLKIYSKFDEELSKKWVELESNALITVFQTYYFQKIWYQNIGSKLNKVPYIFVYENNHEVIAIYPLQISSLKFANIINFMAAEQSDYSGPLLNNNYLKIIDYDFIWESIFNALGKNNIYSFDKVPIDNKLLSVGKYNKFRIAGFNQSHSLNLNMKYRLSNISDIKRQVRKLSAMGRLTFKVLKNNQPNFYNNYSNFTVMKNERLRLQNKKQLFSEEFIYDFYLDLLINNKTSHIFKIYSLEFDGKKVAACISAVFNGRYYYLIPAFKMGFLNYSWGSILIYYLIRFSNKFGLNIFDMTLGDEVYKRKYCNSSMNLASYFYTDNFLFKYYYLIKIAKMNLKNNIRVVKILNSIGIK